MNLHPRAGSQKSSPEYAPWSAFHVTPHSWITNGTDWRFLLFDVQAMKSGKHHPDLLRGHQQHFSNQTKPHHTTQPEGELDAKQACLEGEALPEFSAPTWSNASSTVWVCGTSAPTTLPTLALVEASLSIWWTQTTHSQSVLLYQCHTKRPFNVWL